MNNLIQNTTAFAMSIACRYAAEDGLIIDATCGNGHDTLALARYSREKSLDADIAAFDVQKTAINSTKALLTAEGFGSELESGKIRLIQTSHEYMANKIQNRRACLIVFNLGYLPGGDKSITTSPAPTLAAVQSALDLLALGGLICVTMYSGHDEGAREKQVLLRFAEELDPHQYHVSYISMINQPNCPPEILLISRKR